MLFRPEEVHARSTIGSGLKGPADLTVGITDNGLRLDGEEFLILHFHYHRLPTIQTVGLKMHFLAGEEPADRQRFETSLGEPFLFTVYGDAVLGGLVVEGRERGNPVRLGVDPTGHPGSHQVME